MKHHHGHNHLAIGVLIAFAVAATCALGLGEPWLAPGYAAAGAGFYLGREAMDYHHSGRFDRVGFYWPVIPLGGLDVACRAWSGDWTLNLDMIPAAYFAGIAVRELEKSHGWNWRDPKWWPWLGFAAFMVGASVLIRIM
jgi:hypothetical protein